MIDHNLTQFGLTESYEGEQVQPSEKGNLHIPSTLRQFIIQANRAYSQETLEVAEINEGVHVNIHEGDITHEVPYFYLKLVVQPTESIKEFIENNGDEFFTYLLDITGQSNIRFVRGKRAAFVGEFNRVSDPEYGDVMTSHILVGTSVFYNDYRVTTNFPASHNELELVVGELYQAILDKYPSLKIEFTFEVVGEQEDVFA